MASLVPGDFSQLEGGKGGPHKVPHEKLENNAQWYFSRKEIEENSPSRNDGIDLKKETYLRKSYCTFLQDLGMRLKVPQVTIATSIIFCHRFYLRQSHSKNDRRTIATACMFLAGKVEETPRPLRDVILVYYEIMHKKDAAAVQKIKQKDVYEQHKELILLGERVVLATLGFDMNVQHPYKPVVEAIKKFKVAQNALAQVAWNFVNDGLRTSLCLQCKPHHIAAGAIFLAAKFLKVKLPSDGEKVWWQEFDVTPRQLEEVSNQMLELYEQNRAATNQGSEAEGSVVGGAANQPTARTLVEEVPKGNSQAGASAKPGLGKPPTSHQLPDHSSKHAGSLRNSQNYKVHAEPRSIEPLVRQENSVEGPDTRAHIECNSGEDNKEKNIGGTEVREEGDSKEKYHINDLEFKETAETRLPSEMFEKIDAIKLKEIREKRKKSRGEVVRKKESMEEYDPILKELEEGVEQAAAECEKIKQEKKQNWLHEMDIENVEEAEVSALEESSWDYHSPKSNDRKRKAGSPLDKTSDGKHWRDRDHKRHLQENHA